MEFKKNKAYDLERKSPLFFSIGLVISLLFVVLAFEWKSEHHQLEFDQLKDHVEEMYLPVATVHKVPKPPKVGVRKVEKPKISQLSVIVEGEEVKTTKANIDVEIVDIDIPTELLKPAKPEEPEYYEGPVESAPNFPGGMDQFYKYVAKNMVFPSQARRMGIEGKVFVRFIINIDGSVTGVEVIKGIGAGCDEAARKVLENAPKFIPAKNRGREVRYRQVIPIYFKLSN